MKRTSESAKREAFRKLHDPNRPVFQIAHARRGNEAEDYDSGEVRAASERAAKTSMGIAEGVIAEFAARSKKSV